MKVPKADFFMIVLLVLVFIVSMFIVLKPTKFLSMASEIESEQVK